jgi:hypothetical protein
MPSGASSSYTLQQQDTTRQIESVLNLPRFSLVRFLTDRSEGRAKLCSC